MIDGMILEQLLRPAGQALLVRAAALPDLGDRTLLRHLTRLRREVPAALASAALETVLLRRRAAAKFSRAGQMYFSRDALEQASAEVVSRHRARRFASYRSVADLGCGLGGDTIALATAVPLVIAIDRDPVRLTMAAANVAAYGVQSRVRFVQADLLSISPADAEAAFCDPARRTAAGTRLYHVEQYEPPLSLIRARWPAHAALAVKASPGIDHADLAALGDACEVEFISVAGELREAVLWFGPLRSAARRATLLPEGHTLTETGAPPAPVGPPGRYLLDPDPAVYRAGLLTELAATLGARQIDPTIAYLTADVLQETPWARAWLIDEVLPFSVKGVRRRLRALNVGAVVVKKRGSPLDPQEFERLLRLEGTEQRTLVLTRVAGRPVCLICRETPRTG